MKSNIRIKFITIISLVLALFSSNITIADTDKKVSNSINYDENSDKKSALLISTFYDDKDLEGYCKLKGIADIFKENDEWTLEVREGKEDDVNTFREIGKIPFK